MADKLRMMSSDIIQENIDYIADKFPSALVEVINENGKLVKKIDFDILKQELSNILIDDKKEKYQMTWPDKKKSILLANSKISATLRPITNLSVDFNLTRNLYVEGENLDVLKLLRETYFGKVKMIYIDPPYNTGHDWVYDDDFKIMGKEYSSLSGDYDNLGNKLFQNSDANGRFHTDWLNMMYSRLKVAKDFLTNDGVIAISIDENEVHNLGKICEELFGTNNIDYLVWQKTDPWVDRNTNAKQVSRFLEFKEFIILCYKNKKSTYFGRVLRLPDWKNAQKNIDNDPRGNWQSGIFSYEEGHANEDKNSESYFTITLPSGRKVTRMWFVENEDEYNRLKNDGMLYFGPDGDSVPRIKTFENLEKLYYLTSILRGYGTSSSAKDELRAIFDGNLVFDTPKPTKLIKELIRCITNNNDIIMDFFSGSGTTADAIMSLNAEMRSARKFIMVQLPENLDDKLKIAKGEVKKNIQYAIDLCDKKGFDHFLTNIAEERIRIVRQRIINENKNIQNFIDLGFRVLKLDSSNVKDVYYNPSKLDQNLFDNMIDNVKEDRTPLDLLFQVMLELGIELSAKIEEKEFDGKKYFIVNENDIVACFDKNINNDLVKELATIKPIYAVFRDASFETDSTNINCEQIFKSISPSTNIKVL